MGTEEVLMAPREDGGFLLPAAPDVDSYEFMVYGAELATQAIMKKAAKLGVSEVVQPYAATISLLGWMEEQLRVTAEWLAHGQASFSPGVMLVYREAIVGLRDGPAGAGAGAGAAAAPGRAPDRAEPAGSARPRRRYAVLGKRRRAARAQYPGDRYRSGGDRDGRRCAGSAVGLGAPRGRRRRAGAAFALAAACAGPGARCAARGDGDRLRPVRHYLRGGVMTTMLDLLQARLRL